jgi:predicted transcriptional regulator
MESKSMLQSQKFEVDGEFVRAIKQKEENKKNVVLVKKKPSIDSYVRILKSIKMGACYPSMIVASSRVPWLTVMQCVRTLELKGLIQTGYDAETGRVVSRLTEKGKGLLDQRN